MEAPEPQEERPTIRNAGEMISLLTGALKDLSVSNWARAVVNLGIFFVALIALILYAFGGGC